MKNYEELVDTKNTLQNKFALNTLLEVGRKNLLDEKYCKEMLNNIDKNDGSFMTSKYQRGIFEIAIKMAKLSDKDLCEYIYDKRKEERKLERGR